jgi:type II secretory pathway component GspD/PulD (secretin)
MERIRVRERFPLVMIPLLALLVGASTQVSRAQDQEEPLLITLEADSTSVTDILQILASRSGMNIVTSPEVQGRKVSIRLGQTPFEEALNLVVRAAGLGYERVGNSILVADPSSLARQTGLTTKVFDLKYADAATVLQSLKVLTSDVTADLATNQVVIRESQSLVEQATAIVAELDRKPRQVMIEARLIEVNTSDLLELGIDWEKIVKFSSVIGEGPMDASAKGQLPEQLDYIKADKYNDIYRQNAAFEVTLDALLTEGSAKLLSHAKVAAQDNTPAEIFVGETVPVVVTSLSTGTGGGTFQTIQLEKIDVGVKLDITPRISEEGYVTAIVEPEVSTITAFVGPDNDLPQTATRRAKTIVRVRDGEHVYLGGLLQENNRRTVKKVPLLGSIPLLGHFFRHYRNEKIRSDLVIEVTPTIIGDSGSTGDLFPPGQEGGE